MFGVGLICQLVMTVWLAMGSSSHSPVDSPVSKVKELCFAGKCDSASILAQGLAEDKRLSALPDIVIGELGDSVALCWYRSSQYYSAYAERTREFRLWHNLCGDSDRRTIGALNGLALACDGLERYGEAESLFVRAISLAEGTLGKDDAILAVIHSNLASLFWQTNRYPESESLYQRSMEIYMRIFGSNDGLVAEDLNGIADLYRDQGRCSEAESLYQRAMAWCGRDFL